jgi:hypothetical protein
VLSLTTERGRWIAPATRAIWVPAGTTHEHRAYGRTELHLVGLPVDPSPLGLTEPAILAVGRLRGIRDSGQPHAPSTVTF